MSLNLNPVFLALAMQAQDHFSKARRMDDRNAIAGTFCINDMLDMLDEEIDREKEATK